ncbi:restriction endonuclease subunit S [Xanthomonas citri]|uniref:restriction endonuclease subunit S n=1 Tax=Xanthomonas citri TaxID=346 RepID=UPI001884BCA6|nr:restriction endonuclease subunit S [Xanthomonas citri]QOY21004.1 restriction endonuclease subunit S [Xanthomonas citri]QQK67129.1 restriction endonuclease subunit S [Xanthomonas citri]
MSRERPESVSDGGAWVQVPLSALYEFKNGVNADRRAYGQGIPFINVLEPITFSHLQGREISGRVDLPDAAVAAYEVRNGDLVFNRTSEIGEEVGLAAAYLGTERVVFGGFVIRARPVSAMIDANFAAYAMRASDVRSQIIAMGQGAVRANIGQENLRRVELKLPPLPEQLAIAKALIDADALIDSLEQLLTKKRQIKQGAMDELFTQRRRLPGHSNPWAEAHIGDFTDCTAGGTPSTRVESYWGGAIPWMSSGDLHLKRVDAVDGRITENGLNNSSTKWILPRCVLIGLAGQGKTRGTVAMNLIPLCTNQSIAAIFPSDTYDSEFLYHNLDWRYEDLRELSTGDGGRGGLNLTLIRSIKVPKPCLAEQKAISQVLSDIDSEITALYSRLAKARALKQAMAQALLTGRIRLVEPAA